MQVKLTDLLLWFTEEKKHFKAKQSKVTNKQFEYFAIKGNFLDET
jgi:hypothetical protein